MEFVTLGRFWRPNAPKLLREGMEKRTSHDTLDIQLSYRFGLCVCVCDKNCRSYVHKITKSVPGELKDGQTEKPKIVSDVRTGDNYTHILLESLMPSINENRANDDITQD